MDLAEAKKSVDIVGIIGQTVELRRAGREFSGRCPFHDDANPSFTVNQARQFFHCFGCGASGDVIDFVMRRDNCDLATACSTLGLEVEGRPVRRCHATPAPARRPGPVQSKDRPRAVDPPSGQWISAAGEFVDWCHASLIEDDDAMAWLAARGLSHESVITHRLGWCPGRNGRALYRPRSEWGLPEERDHRTGRRKPLWLPRGWVLPLRDAKGRVVQIRIRRTDEDLAAFLPTMKYRVVPGSSMATMVLGRDRDSYLVCENGFDAILIHQEAGDLVGAVTSWSATTMPDAAAHRLLSRARAILVATDYDEAGRKGAERLAAVYRAATWWPVPIGNDIGDAWAAGVDLRAWIADGLPWGCAQAAAVAVRADSPDGVFGDKMGTDASGDRGGAGADHDEPVSWEVELTDGRLVYVTDDRPTWDGLARDGKMVFTSRELMRVQAALADVDEDERPVLLDRILDAKQVFSCAYVASGAGRV